MTRKLKNIILIIMVLLMIIQIGTTCVQAASTTTSAPTTGQTTPDTIDGVMQGAEGFLQKGKDIPVDETQLKGTSDFIFNLLLGFAMIAAVIVGMVIGIKFMMASIEEKAQIKEALVPYVVGCVVVFGAFGIWKVAVTILSSW